MAIRRTPIRRCEACGKVLPGTARAGTRFCNATCRSTARRLAQRIAAAVQAAQGDTSVIARTSEDTAAIADAWAGFTPSPDTDGSQAAVAALARATPYSGAGIEALPGLVRADDGSWVESAYATVIGIIASGFWPEEEARLTAYAVSLTP